MAKRGDYPIPFSKAGNQQHYPENFLDYDVWVDNFEFEDTLVFKDYHRGRSAAYFEFTRKSTGTTVTMFLKDFVEAVKLMVNGEFTGRFTFTKRGANYGCRVIQ